MEYAGYDPNWVLGQRRETPYYYVPSRYVSYDEYDGVWALVPESGSSHGPRKIWRHYSPRYGHDAYYHRDGYSHSPSRRYHYDQHDRLALVRLAWPTEIPVTLRVSICCDRCRFKLYEDLRDLEGVYDVGISGWSDAIVAVTGTAPEHKILERARRSSKHAECWSHSSDYKRSNHKWWSWK